MDKEENEVLDGVEDIETEDTDSKEIVWKNIWSQNSQFTPLKEPPKKETSNYIPNNLTFIEKLKIWTKNFTIEPMNLEILKADGNRAIPAFSNADEYEKYQKIINAFSDYTSLHNKDVKEIWEMVKQEHPDLFIEASKEKEDDGEER